MMLFALHLVLRDQCFGDALFGRNIFFPHFSASSAIAPIFCLPQALSCVTYLDTHPFPSDFWIKFSFGAIQASSKTPLGGGLAIKKHPPIKSDD